MQFVISGMQTTSRKAILADIGNLFVSNFLAQVNVHAWPISALCFGCVGGAAALIELDSSVLFSPVL
jgi:hypothetical protein